MAFNDLNYIASVIGNRRVTANKGAPAGNYTIGGNPLQSFWNMGTFPGSARLASVVLSAGGEVLTAASSGSLFQPTNPAAIQSGGNIAGINIFIAGVAGQQVEVWDRLWQAQYTSGPSHSIMTVSMAPVVRSHGSGNRLFYDAVSPAANVRSIAVTIETFSLDVRTANFNIPASLAAGAQLAPIYQLGGEPAGIRRILTVHAPNSATVSSGAFVIRRSMCEMPGYVNQQPYKYNMFDLGFPDIMPDAALELLWRPVSTTACSVQLTMNIVPNSV